VKPLVCLGSSRDELRAFPADARARAGYELYQIQVGNEPRNWKPLSTVGPGVREIRIAVGRHFRVVYVTQFEEAIYVLHAFEKKSRQTSQRDVDIARQRLAELRRRNRR
jgi:phage-related protein